VRHRLLSPKLFAHPYNHCTTNRPNTTRERDPVKQSRLIESGSTWLIAILIPLGATGCTKVSASRYDEARECFVESEVAGRMVSKGCDDATSLRRGPDGELWKFNQTCAPPRYEEVDMSREALNDIKFSPPCDSLNRMTTGDAGQMSDTPEGAGD
jgi:hypothetical protein